MRHHYRLRAIVGCTGTCRRHRLLRPKTHSSKTCCCPCHRRMRLRAFIRRWLIFWRYNKDICRDEPSHKELINHLKSRRRARHGSPELQDSRDPSNEYGQSYSERPRKHSTLREVLPNNLTRHNELRETGSHRKIRSKDRATKKVLAEGQQSKSSSRPCIMFYDRDKPFYQFTNFSPHPIKLDGRTYPTAEHLFQAHKFLGQRPEFAERIRLLPSPRDALQEASRLKRLQRSDWFEVNVGIMDRVLELKFDQHPDLALLLVSTGHSELIEDSPVDSFWGVGKDRQGRNELGKALMRLRNRLQQ